MKRQRLPLLPALATTAVVKDYFAISGASAGAGWPFVFPLEEWRQSIPSLPSGKWGMLSSSDHNSGSGTWYLDTTDATLPVSGWTDNTTPILTGANQEEMPVLNLNKRKGVVEVYSHISAGNLYGYSSEQKDQYRETTDFATFTTRTDVRIDGGYACQHPGYGQIVTLDSGRELWIKNATGGEHATEHILHRDHQERNWRWDGKHINPNAPQLHGALNKCMFSVPRLFQWMGQWFRLSCLTNRPRLTTGNTLEIVAYPVSHEDFSTPLAGYQTLVQESSGYRLTNYVHPVVVAGQLFVFYTEQNTTSGQNRHMVAYNASEQWNPNPSSPATLTNPATEIFPDGRLWEHSAVQTRYAHGRRGTLPSWANLFNNTGTSTVSATANGMRITGNSNDASWTWAVDEALAVNPATAGNDVLLATWYGLRSSQNNQHGLQLGFANDEEIIAGSNSILLFASIGDTLRQDIELFEFRASSAVVQDVSTWAWDFRTHIAYWQDRPFDLSIAIFDAGSKFAVFIDGICCVYKAMTDNAIGAVVPVIKTVPTGSNSVTQWLQWSGFEFEVLSGIDPTRETLKDLQAVIAELRAANEQLASDATRHHRELGRLGDTRRAVTNR